MKARSWITLALAVCLPVVAAVGPASAGPTQLAYAAPAAIAKRIIGSTPQIPTSSDIAPSNITASVCHGLGTAHQGKYNRFRCSATWDPGQKTSTVWVRARPGGQFCASSTTLAPCPAAPPSVGDPRVCRSAVSPYADPNHCALAAAAFVVSRAMPVRINDPSWTVRDETCKGDNLRWSCEFATHGQFGSFFKGAITFAQNAKGKWSARIAISGGGSANAAACKVLPGAAGSATSRWFSGPTPVCTN
jgi:hypothetical protein